MVIVISLQLLSLHTNSALFEIKMKLLTKGVFNSFFLRDVFICMILKDLLPSC